MNTQQKPTIKEILVEIKRYAFIAKHGHSSDLSKVERKIVSMLHQFRSEEDLKVLSKVD